MTHLLRILIAPLLAASVLAGCAATDDDAWPQRVVTIEQLRPETPLQARIALISRSEATPGGTTVLHLHVDATGTVRRGRIVESSGSSRQDLAALDAAKQGRFTPFIENGVAVPVTAVVPMHFPAMAGKKRLPAIP